MTESKSRRIAIDVDNVLADSAGSFCKKWSKKWRVNVNPSMIKYPKIIGSFKADPREIMKVQQEVWLDWKNLALVEQDAGKTIRSLRNANNTIEIATSRPQNSVQNVLCWLKQNCIEYDTFKRFDVRESKATIYADVLVDDDQRMIFDFVQMTKVPRIGLLYDRPWNRDVLLWEDRIFRITSLKEVQSH